MSSIVDTLQQILQGSPGSWQYRLALVEALVAENRTEEATAILAEPTDLPPDQDSQIKAARAHGLLDPANGLQILEPVIQSEPTCAAAHFEKAILTLRTGDHPTANRHYFTALTFDPTLENAQFESQLDEVKSKAKVEPAPSEPPPTSVLPVADSEVTAVAVEETAPEFTTQLPAVVPAPQPVVLIDEPPAADPEPTHHPTPVPFHVQTLREALETRSIHVRPLVRPESIPPPPALVHQELTRPHALAHTRSHPSAENLHNVYVHPITRQEPVVYDYQNPDESLFTTALTADDFYVAAPEADPEYHSGDALASLLLNRRRSDLQLARQRRRNKVSSAFTGIMVMGALALLLWMIKLAIPESKPPEIIANAGATSPEKSLKKKVVVRQVNQAPTPPSAAPMSLQVITSATSAAVAAPSIDSPDAVDLQLGTSFGAGTGFGNTPGIGAGSGTFFGSRVTGGMAVIFDITGSMYGANPRVVTEINRHFKDAQVVAVFGATFRDVGSDDLIPYKKNEDVLANVDKNGKKSETQLGMNKALFSLAKCDSLTSKGWEIQSLGKAIEALLNQPANQQPRTIFIFSDFQDGVDLTYMEKVQELVRRRRAKIVFYHPVAFTKDEAHYREFAKLTKGEVKEGLPK